MQVKNLTLTRRDNDRVLVDSLSFALNAGDRVAVVGEEGNGKSTLIKYLYDPALTEDFVRASGSVLQRPRRMGFLPQELPPAALALSAAEYVDRAGADNDMDPGLVRRLTDTLGLPGSLPFDRRPLSLLSGGEKVKLQLAVLLAREPELLLLDEPTNDIDGETLLWLEQFLLTCRIPLMYVSHDETLLERTANAVVHLEHLHLKQEARSTFTRLPYRAYAETRLRAFSRQEQICRKEHAAFSEKEARHRRIYEQVETAQRNVSRGDPSGGRLLKKKMHAVQSQGKRLEREKERLTPAPVFEDEIDLSFPPVRLPRGKEVLRYACKELCAGGHVLARDVSLTVRGGERIGITGRNGAGKTTLLGDIAAVLLPRGDIAAYYMPQNYLLSLPPEETPVSLLAPDGDKAHLTRARTYLGSVKFTRDEMVSPVTALSGGQRAKLLFLQMVLGGYDVLILDEPTRNLSPLSNPVVRGILSSFGGAIISVSHDRRYLSEVCTRVLTLTPEGLTETV